MSQNALIGSEHLRDVNIKSFESNNMIPIVSSGKIVDIWIEESDPNKKNVSAKVIFSPRGISKYPQGEKIQIPNNTPVFWITSSPYTIEWLSKGDLFSSLKDPSVIYVFLGIEKQKKKKKKNVTHFIGRVLVSPYDPKNVDKVKRISPKDQIVPLSPPTQIRLSFLKKDCLFIITDKKSHLFSDRYPLWEIVPCSNRSEWKIQERKSKKVSTLNKSSLVLPVCNSLLLRTD